MHQTLVFILAAASAGASLVLDPRSDNTAIVNLAASRGPSKHSAAGFIYGIPDNGNQIPSH